MGYWLYACSDCGTVRVDVHDGDECDLAIYPNLPAKELREAIANGNPYANMPHRCTGAYRAMEKM